jgi:hypothetical protein
VVVEVAVVLAQEMLPLEMVGRVVELVQQQRQLVELEYLDKDMLAGILFLTAVLEAAALALLDKMFML